MPDFDDYRSMALRVQPAAGVTELERRRRPGWTDDGTPVDERGVRLLTVDEISERFDVPRCEVALWVASGRLHGVYLPHDHRRFRETQVEALVGRLADLDASPTHRVVSLDVAEVVLLDAVRNRRIRQKGGVDYRRNRSGRWQPILSLTVRLTPGLVEKDPGDGLYRLTKAGARALAGRERSAKAPATGSAGQVA